MADGVLITKESARKLKKLLQGSPGGRSPGQHRVFRDIFVPRVVVITALPEETDEYTGKLLETERDEGPLEIKLVNLTEGPGGQRVMAMDQKAVCWRVGKDILTTEGYTLSEDTEVVFAAFDFGGGGDTGPGGSSLISTAKVTQVPSPGDYQAVEQTDEIGIGVEADTIDSTNIEFIEDEKVQLRSDDTLPAPFLPNTDYFVINAAGLVCQLASNAEGDPIDIEDAGTGTHTVIFKDRPPSEPPTWPIYTGQVLNDNYSAEDDEETEETEGPDTIEFVNLLDWPGREALLRLDDLVPIWRVPTDTLAAVGTEKVDDFAWRAETATFTADADEDTITAGDHEFSENEPLTFSSTGDLPEPLAVGTTYYAVSVDGSSCHLAESEDGDPIDIGDAGTGTHTVHFQDQQITAEWATIDPGRHQPTLMVSIVEVPTDAKQPYTGRVLDQHYSEMPWEVQVFHLNEVADGELLLESGDKVPVWLIPNDTLTSLGFDPDEAEPLNYATVTTPSAFEPNTELAIIKTVAGEEMLSYSCHLLNENFAGTPDAIGAFNLRESMGSGAMAPDETIVAVHKIRADVLEELDFEPGEGQNWAFLYESFPGITVKEDIGVDSEGPPDTVFYTVENVHTLKFMSTEFLILDPEPGVAEVYIVVGTEPGELAAGDDPRFDPEPHPLLGLFDGSGPERHTDTANRSPSKGAVILGWDDGAAPPFWDALIDPGVEDGDVLTWDSAVADVSVKWAPVVPEHDLLDGNYHPDTVMEVPARGRMILGSDTLWDVLEPPGPDEEVEPEEWVLVNDEDEDLGVKWLLAPPFHTLLSGINHTDTAAASPDLGAVILGDGSLWDALDPATGDDGDVLTLDSGEPLGAKWAPQGGVSASALIPIGGMIPFPGDTAPTDWLLCDGQDIEPGTYPELAAVLKGRYGYGDLVDTVTADAGTDRVTGPGPAPAPGIILFFTSSGTLPGGISANTPYYVRDQSGNTYKLSLTDGGTAIDITSAGSGTHSAQYEIKVPDLRGRAPFGKDDMGGSAASRLTGTTMTPNGTTLGATGGAQTHTLTTGEIPAHTHGLHGNANGTPGGAQPYARYDGAGANTGATDSAGSGGAHNNMPPAIITNWIIRAE